MKNVLVVYHYIAHYRVPIFKELVNSKDFNFKIVAGFETEANIKIATEDNLNNNKISFLKVKNLWLFKKKFLFQKGLLQLVLKRENKIFIFLGNPYFISTWISILLCKILRKRVSIWTHGITKKVSGLNLILFKLLWTLSDDILLYGNYAKNEMVLKGVNPKKMHVIYNSLDYKKQIEIRNTLNKTEIYTNHFKNNYPVIIFSGRLNKAKKLEMILESQKILYDKNIFFNVVFVGDGPESTTLKSIVDKLNLSHLCWFYGACYNESKIGELFFNAEICLAPGNVGLTAMHAMVYGTPVITHSNFSLQMPEFEAIDEGKTGSFFKRDDIKDLVNVLRSWLIKSQVEKNDVKQHCYAVIDQKYNPTVQRLIISKVLKN